MVYKEHTTYETSHLTNTQKKGNNKFKRGGIIFYKI